MSQVNFRVREEKKTCGIYYVNLPIDLLEKLNIGTYNSLLNSHLNFQCATLTIRKCGLEYSLQLYKITRKSLNNREESTMKITVRSAKQIRERA